MKYDNDVVLCPYCCQANASLAGECVYCGEPLDFNGDFPYEK